MLMSAKNKEKPFYKVPCKIILNNITITKTYSLIWKKSKVIFILLEDFEELNMKIPDWTILSIKNNNLDLNYILSILKEEE